VIAGAFVTSIDMNSGAPTFGTPEAAHITYGAGQLVRRLGLPYRSGGSFCGSKLPDAQAAYETANSLNMALLAGVNFMLHACGWLEGGLVSSYEKFVMDADQLGDAPPPCAGDPGRPERPGDGRDPRSWPRRPLPGLQPHPGELQVGLLAVGPSGLQALRDLGRGRRARHAVVANERVQEAWPTTRPRHGPRHPRGAGGFVARRKAEMPDAFI
jgi:trimethylamine---corrinoid protein Co-methyltransferase